METYTVIDNVLDDFESVRALFYSALFGMSDCFLRLTDNVSDTVLPLGAVLGPHITIQGGAFLKSGKVSPRFQTSIAVVTLVDSIVNGIQMKENQCLLVQDFKELEIEGDVAIVMYGNQT